MGSKPTSPWIIGVLLRSTPSGVGTLHGVGCQTASILQTGCLISWCHVNLISLVDVRLALNFLSSPEPCLHKAVASNPGRTASTDTNTNFGQRSNVPLIMTDDNKSSALNIIKTVNLLSSSLERRPQSVLLARLSLSHRLLSQ